MGITGTGSGEVDGFLLSSCLMMESLEDGTCFFILVIICLNFVLCFFFFFETEFHGASLFLNNYT